jgi:hypothetical protein
MFQVLMVATSATSAPSSAGAKTAEAAAQSASGTCVRAASTMVSVRASAARSLALKNGDSRHTGSAASRPTSSPPAIASRVCSFTQ